MDVQSASPGPALQHCHVARLLSPAGRRGHRGGRDYVTGAPHSPIATAIVWIALAAGLIAVAGFAWHFLRPRLFSSDDALARLDAIGRLHNRLTAARAGVSEWATPDKIGDGLRWNWRRIFGATGPAVILLVGTAWVNVPQRTKHERPTEPPVAWEQIESWLQTLEESGVVQAEALETLRAQMDSLRRQPAEHWYSQASLEASDTLREQPSRS